MAWRRGIAVLGIAAAAAAVSACGGGDLTGVGGDQILSFVDNLAQPVTFLYCPEQGCSRPLLHALQPGQDWRVQSETINGAGAVSITVGRHRSGCRLVPAIGFDVRPVAVFRASVVRGGAACVRARARGPRRAAQ
jgi:hypothetical protein